jgi:N-acetylmuramoyl-L-alanine amidase
MTRDNNRSKFTSLCWGLLMLLAAPLVGAATQVEGIRMWSSPEGTRVVFDLNHFVQHAVFLLKEPDRLVVDLAQTSLAHPVAGLEFAESLLTGLRAATRNDDDLRVVLDTKMKVKYNSFLLNPTQRYGYRLVIDLEPATATDSTLEDSPRPTSLNFDSGEPRAVIIAIDAGHGGEDPGAVGRQGTLEKDVVLAIARKLEILFSQEWGIRPVLIRQGDYYVSLRDRIRKARSYQADLFISIHADAYNNRSANGASVYVLSQKGASSEAARWLAASENSSDLLGGVSLDDKDDLLASVLLDLSQNATIAASMEIGSKMLDELERVGSVHKRRVEQAGFVVLKSPDVPSVLVETGFISNSKEERYLRDADFQNRIARAILKGVRRYFRDNPPPGTLLAQRQKEIDEQQHVIVRGDTLSSIARKYSISPLRLRKANNLDSDSLQIGQILVIP